MSLDPTRFVKTKPLHIGVCGGAGQSQSLVQMLHHIRASGAVPHLMIDHGNYSCSDAINRDVQQDLSMVDAVVIMGNNADLDPASYGQTPHPATIVETTQPGGQDRQCYETALIEGAKQRNMPVLAICGGMQRVNVLLGGSLHQHVPDLFGGSTHREQPCHGGGDEGQTLVSDAPLITNGSFHIDPDSKIGRRMDVHEVQEVCAHHQAIDRLGTGLRPTITGAGPRDRYRDADGKERSLIDGIESDPEGPLAGWPMIGFQFHPEFERSPVLKASMGWLHEEAAKYHATHPTPHARTSMVVRSEFGTPISL